MAFSCASVACRSVGGWVDRSDVGCVCVQVDEYVEVWMDGCVGGWVCGRLGVWVYGCVGGQECVCVCVCVCVRVDEYLGVCVDWCVGGMWEDGCEWMSMWVWLYLGMYPQDKVCLCSLPIRTQT